MRVTLSVPTETLKTEMPSRLPPLVAGETLLNEEAYLTRSIAPVDIQAWVKESAVAKKPRRARLLIQIGEVELANQEPAKAQSYFDRAAGLLPVASPDRGLARFDTALALFFQGRFSASRLAFRHAAGSSLKGVDQRLATLYARHAAACQGYHEQHSELGIPEPPFLDPLCGVSSVAVCLKARGLPYSRSFVEKQIPYNGEGSSMAQLASALPSVGLFGRMVSANDVGLRLLPKPLVAHVEHDHFVAVVKADREGVSYVCSDCGPFPGGRVDLDWKQWHAMEADRYLVVAPTGSPQAQAIANLPTSDRDGQGHVLLASRDASRRTAEAEHLLSVLGTTVIAQTNPVSPPVTSICGNRGQSPHCPCVDSSPNQDSAGFPPGTRDPVNLATGEEQYSGSGLHVYNPTGPSVNWRHSYYSLANVTPNGWGSGWTHPYNVRIEDNSGVAPVQPNTGITNIKSQAPSVLILPDTTQITFTTNSNNPPTASNPVVAATVQTGIPIIVDWCYNTATGQKYFTVEWSNRSKWTFQPSTGAGALEYPIQIADRIGNYIELNWQTFTFKTQDPITMGFQAQGLTSITDSSGVALLTLSYDSNSRNVSVSDRYDRSLYYTVQSFANTGVPPGYLQANDEVTQVSQVVPTGTSNPAVWYEYGYRNYGNTEQGDAETIPYLHTIAVPSPTGTGQSTATINYSSIGEVTSTVDANGNITAYSAATSGGVPQADSGRVKIETPSGAVVYQYDAYFNSQMSQTKLVNSAGQTVWTKTFSDPNSPYGASSITDGNNRTWDATYDQYTNQVTYTTPKNTKTVNTYTYTNFPLGELTSTQQGSKTPTSFTYLEPSGLIHTVLAPIPGQVGTNQTQTTTYTYDSVGNVTQITQPGNNVGTHTVSFGYTTDGTYSQNECLGEPITLKDALGNVDHLRYDQQRNILSMTDALGNERQYSYNIANQTASFTYPATGQTGSGNAVTTKTFLYPAGPVSQETIANEAGATFRTYTYGYGAEGELLSRSGNIESATWAYDAAYHCVSIKDGNGNTTKVAFDLSGRPSSMTYPLESGTNYDQIQYTSYDAVNNPLAITDGTGQTVSLTYGDADGMLSQIAYAGRTQFNSSFGYDLYDRMNSASDASGSRSATYDDLSDVLTSTATYTGLAALYVLA